MSVDLALKVIFRKRARDLLALTGDAHARVLGTDVVELQALRRCVDFVVRLERDGETYPRHIEFQLAHRRDLLRRCFEYNCRLLLQCREPVLTTVVYVEPPAPRGAPAFRVVLAGREVNRWVFDALRLWEIDARSALDAGLGVMPLLPAMGGASLALVATAAERIRAGCVDGRTDLLAALRVFAERRYTAAEVSRIIGRAEVMQSSLWQEALAEGQARGLAEGEARGLAEGAVLAERQLCAAVVRKHHPKLLSLAGKAIASCDDPKTLTRWVLAAPDLTDEEYARLLGLRQRRRTR